MGPENQRLLFAMLAVVAIITVWQLTSAPRGPAPAPPAPPAAPQATAPQGQPGAATGAPAPAVPAPPPEAPEEIVTLQGDGFRVELSSRGGAIRHIVLEGEKYKREQAGKTVPIDLVRVAEGQPLLFSVVPSPELGGAADPAADPAARASMRTVEKDARSVTFEGRAGPLGVRKTFRLTGDPFEIAVEMAVTGGDRPGSAGVVFPGFRPPDAKGGGFLSGPPLDLVRPICRAGEKTERFKVDGDEASQALPGAVSWVGVDQHYFVAAAFPRPDPAGTCLFTKGPEKGSGAATLFVPVGAGTRAVAFELFAGPKDLDLLEPYGRSFGTAIDYGAVANLFSFFARPLLLVLRFFEHRFHDWGVAIVLLTLTVKVVLYPLTAKSMKSMNQMRRLQPEIEKLKKKYGDDRERLSLEQMKLFQQHKVNPLGGCLPMLIQLPIWFALYATLQTSVELYREPFLWVNDLSHHDPFFVLPLATGVLMFVQQKISPQPADNAQAKMMLYMMPGMFTVMMIFVPAGLTLYIFANSALSIAQQQWMMKRMPPPPAAA
ncbi:MAG TPA: membrane protein insertase YidC [Anaeromyxobacteraceae bacterium]|nr:membrane protein insertase YidC [Anaeromyxobacteraceae bacterium]